MKDKKSADISTAPTDKKRLGFGWFIAAAVFLANPCLNVIDILPDFFGCIFLLKGLEKWADLCPNVRDAVQNISRLRWFMLLKLFAAVLVPLVDATYVLIFTFAFTVIELIYAIPAIGHIFGGLEYFGTRFDGKAAFRGLRDLRVLTLIFYFVKSAFCLFPELCELSSYNYSGVVTGGVQINPATYKNPLILLNLLVCTVLGIIWLVAAVKYIRRVSDDSPFLAHILSDYDREITANTGLKIRRDMRSAFSLIIAGAVFFIILPIDGVNIIPTFIGGAFLIAACRKLAALSAMDRSCFSWAVIFTAAASVSFVLMITVEVLRSFADVDLAYLTDNLIVIIKNSLSSELTADARDSLVDAVRIFDRYRPVYTAFFAYLSAELVKSCTMIVFICKLVCRISKLAVIHLGANSDITDRRLIDIYTNSQKSFARRVTAILVLFLPAALVTAAYSLIRTAISAQLYLIPLVLMGIWTVYLANTLNELYGQIEYKYM